jgi:hypothetical protein
VTGGQTGTFVVDGLLEGPRGDAPDLESRLRDWIRIARSGGYIFSLEIEADTFSLLGENRPIPKPDVESDITEPLRNLLQQLVDSFDEMDRGSLFSTIRTVEYGDGVETQSLYVVAPGGIVDVRQRVVDAETTEAPKPATKKEIARAGIVAFLVLAAVFLISSIFIDYKDMFTRTWRKIAPVDTEAIELDLGLYEPYLVMRDLETAEGGRRLAFVLARTPAFPLSVAEVERLLEEPGLDLAQRKVLESLGAGYVKLELLGKDGKWQKTESVRVAGLRAAETMEVSVRFEREEPPERLVLTW